MQNEIRYFSMFSGVGGFELGLETANLSETKGNEQRGDKRDSPSTQQELLASKQFTCVGQSEFNKYSNQILRYKFPNIKNWGDCTKIKPEDLPDFDMLCGGFPCQSFSIAGKRRGFEDTRGTMFFEIARILEIKRPKIILLENVKGLLNHNKGETFRVIIQTLDELGYEVQWMVLNSKFFGVPQNRERVFIIGNIRGTSRPEILPFGESRKEDDGVYEMQQANVPRFSSYRYYYKEGICPGLRTMQGGNLQPKIYDDYNQKMRTDENFGSITQNIGRKAERNGQKVVERFPLRFPTRNQKNIEGDYAFTVDASNTGGVREGFKIRRPTPVECCRLQGFPDDWNEFGTDEFGKVVKMSDTQRYKQMGNAVTTNVIAALGSQILKKESQDDI